VRAQYEGKGKAVRAEVSEREVSEILASHPSEEASLIHALQDIQGRFGYIPAEAIHAMAEKLKVPVARIYGVVTFYKAFSLEPRGETLIRVCKGTACHVRGAQRLLDDLKFRLGIAEGETTPDRRYTLEGVNCVGACALGPLVIVNHELHGHMDAQKLRRILDRGERAEPNDA
jgi:NADH-quinone oxidoreductase subunit E